MGSIAFTRSLAWVIDDGLMVVFFFVVGMEIRRELHGGELSEIRRAALPLVAAVGGVAAPALLYLWLARDAAARSGWAVPTATDIAFAVGVLPLLGRRVPPALRVLLLALAVIDDLAAIVIIALFYSAGIQWAGLGVAAAGVLGILLMRAAAVRTKSAYVPFGIVVWVGIYASGIHPTIAGVVLGLLTPVQAWLGPSGLLESAPAHLAGVQHVLEREPNNAHAVMRNVRPLISASRETVSPAEALIELLHPWVAFGIMPLFALANAGVSLAGLRLDSASGLGAFVGLVVGKPAGILLATGAALKLGLVRLPAGLTRRHLLVLGLVAGIGFTMALFVAQLAFPSGPLLESAKLGVLLASGAAGILTLGVGRMLLAVPSPVSSAARSADAAERATHL